MEVQLLKLPLVCFFFAAPSLTSTSANCSAANINKIHLQHSAHAYPLLSTIESQ